MTLHQVSRIVTPSFITLELQQPSLLVLNLCYLNLNHGKADDTCNDDDDGDDELYSVDDEKKQQPFWLMKNDEQK